METISLPTDGRVFASWRRFCCHLMAGFSGGNGWGRVAPVASLAVRIIAQLGIGTARSGAYHRHVPRGRARRVHRRRSARRAAGRRVLRRLRELGRDRRAGSTPPACGGCSSRERASTTSRRGSSTDDRIVTCARGASAVPISEWVMAAILAWAKRFPETFLSQPPRHWNFPEPALDRVEGATLALVGLGGIGAAVAIACAGVRYARARACGAPTRPSPVARRARSCARSTTCCRTRRTWCSPRPRPHGRAT